MAYFMDIPDNRHNTGYRSLQQIPFGGERQLHYHLPTVHNQNQSTQYSAVTRDNTVQDIITQSWTDTVEIEARQQEEEEWEENPYSMSYGNNTRWRTQQAMAPERRHGSNLGPNSRMVQGVGGMNVQHEAANRAGRYAKDSSINKRVTYEAHRASDVMHVEYQNENRSRAANDMRAERVGTYPRSTQGTRPRVGEYSGTGGWEGGSNYQRGNGYQNSSYMEPGRDRRPGYTRSAVGFQSGHTGLRQHDLATTHSHGVNQDTINDHTRNTKYSPLEPNIHDASPLNNRDQYTRNTKVVRVDPLGRAQDDAVRHIDISSYQVSAPYAVDETARRGTNPPRSLYRPGDTRATIAARPGMRGGLPGRAHVHVGTTGRVNQQCPVCREYTKDPRVLQCEHSLCRPCLQLINKRPGAIVCPTCRQTTTLMTGEHVEDFPQPYGLAMALERDVIIEVNGVVSDMIIVDDIIAVGTNSKLAPIHMFDFDGHSLAQIGRDIIAPSPKLTHNTRKNLVVANCKTKIATFDNTGALVAQLSNPSFQYAGGVVYNKSMDWYLIPDERTTALLCYNPQAGRIVRTIGLRGDGPNPFSFPACVACDETGLVAISDRKNHLIKVIDLEGRYAQTFGYHGKQYGELNHPLGLCFDQSRRLLICDSGNRRLVRLTIGDMEGQEQWECLLNPPAFGQSLPKAVSLSSNGVLVVSAYQKALSAPDTVQIYNGYS